MTFLHANNDSTSFRVLEISGSLNSFEESTFIKAQPPYYSAVELVQDFRSCRSQSSWESLVFAILGKRPKARSVTSAEPNQHRPRKVSVEFPT